MREVKFLGLTFILVIGWSAIVVAQVDLEGIWNPVSQPGAGEGFGPTRDEDVHLTPAGEAEADAFSTERDTTFSCMKPGIPKGFVDPYPIEIIMQEHQIVILYEYFHQVRRIFMDGREAPGYWPDSLGGYSTGEWDGDTLVVHTTHLSSENDMDTRGRPFSGAADTYVIEKYTRTDNALNLVAEVYDPFYYSAPFPIRRRWEFAPDGEIWEFVCNPDFGGVG